MNGGIIGLAISVLIIIILWNVIQGQKGGRP